MTTDKATTIEPLPTQGAADVGLVVAKTALGFIPFVGGAVTLAELITTPLQRRRDRWLAELAKAVNDLAAQGKITADDLLNNEHFLSVAVRASQIALCSHQAEKHLALKNAVSNSASLPSDALDGDQRFMFLDLIDSLTPTHIRLLKWFDLHQSARDSGQEVETAFPEFGQHESLGQRVLADLEMRGLFVPGKSGALFDPLDTKTRGSFAAVSHVTVFGKAFLRFIESPT